MWAKIINAIKRFFASAFVKKIANILVNVIKEIGEAKFAALKNQVIIVNGQNIPGTEKMKKVFEFARTLHLGIENSAINLIIESIVSEIKGGD